MKKAFTIFITFTLGLLLISIVDQAQAAAPSRPKVIKVFDWDDNIAHMPTPSFLFHDSAIDYTREKVKVSEETLYDIGNEYITNLLKTKNPPRYVSVDSSGKNKRWYEREEEALNLKKANEMLVRIISSKDYAALPDYIKNNHRLTASINANETWKLAPETFLMMEDAQSFSKVLSVIPIKEIEGPMLREFVHSLQANPQQTFIITARGHPAEELARGIAEALKVTLTTDSNHFFSVSNPHFETVIKTIFPNTKEKTIPFARSERKLLVIRNIIEETRKMPVQNVELLRHPCTGKLGSYTVFNFSDDDESNLQIVSTQIQKERDWQKDFIFILVDTSSGRQDKKVICANNILHLSEKAKREISSYTSVAKEKCMSRSYSEGELVRKKTHQLLTPVSTIRGNK